MCTAFFLDSIFQLRFFKEGFLLRRNVKFTNAGEPLGFDRFPQVSLYRQPPLLKKKLIWNLYPSISKAYSLNVLNYLHYWKYPKIIAESENVELKITFNNFGYWLQFIQHA